MHSMFNDLRSDLDCLAKNWSVKLDEIWDEKIKTTEDRDERLALIIEYNRFKDLAREIDWLRNDKNAVTRYSKRIASVKCELVRAREHESVGDEISLLVEDIEQMLGQERPKMGLVCSYIKHAIWALKEGEEVVPSPLKHDIIRRLNECIIKRNKSVLFPKHGIILQVRRYKEFIHCVASIYHVKCNKCKTVMTVSGNSDCDVFAPAKCSKCKSCELYKVHNVPFEPFKTKKEKPQSCMGKLFTCTKGETHVTKRSSEELIRTSRIVEDLYIVKDAYNVRAQIIDQ